MTNLPEKESFLKSEETGERCLDTVLPFKCGTLFPEDEKCGKFKLFDVVVTTFGYLVFVIGLWRGAFGILYHTFDLYQLGFIYLTGSLMNVYFLVMKDSYDKYLNKRTLSHMIFKILYMYTTEMGLIFQWAGSWYTMDHFIGLRVQDLTFSSTCSGVLVIFLGCLVNTLAAPFTVVQLNGKCISRLKNAMCAGEVSVLDHVLSAVVVAPAVVGYWRGTWILSDLYLFPDNYDISMISSLVLGFLGQLIFTYLQNYLTDNLTPDKNRLAYLVASRIYTYVFGAVCVNMWRGIWKALDFFSGQDIVKVLVPTFSSLLFLIVSRILRNVSASPFIVAVDLAEGYFAVPTMFKLTGSKVDSLYVLDALFSVFVVGCLVVFVWRGVWCIFDIYLYPDDEIFSATVSLIVGYAVVLIVFGIQNSMKKYCSKLTGFWRIAVLDIYILFSFIGTINVWRGIWNLLNIYFLPESPALSCWITHFGCFVFLTIMNCSNSLLVRGVAVDGEEEGGKSAVFPTSYLRILCTGSEEKKTEKQDQTAKSKNDVTL